MTELVNPVDSWHTPSPSALLSISEVINDGLGPFSSVSGAMAWACQQVFGTDPFTWINDQLGGDWEAVSAAADCLDQMGDWMLTVTDNAAVHAWSFQPGWEGKAAFAAQGQFMTMSEELAPAVGMVRECARATDWLASKVYAVATVVSAMVEAICMFLAAALFPPSLTLAIPKAITMLLEVIGYLTQAMTMLDTVINGLTGQADSLSALEPVSITSGYDNPMVG